MTVVVWQISGKRRDYSITGAGINGCPYEKKEREKLGSYLTLQTRVNCKSRT